MGFLGELFHELPAFQEGNFHGILKAPIDM